MAENYRMIEVAKERAVNRTGDGVTEITPEDMVGKIEWTEGGDRSYYDGFVDYHGPSDYRDMMQFKYKSQLMLALLYI